MVEVGANYSRSASSIDLHEGADGIEGGSIERKGASHVPSGDSAHVPWSAQGTMCVGCDCAYVCGRTSTWIVCASRYEEAHPTTMSSMTVRQAKWEEEKEKGEEVKGGMGQ